MSMRIDHDEQTQTHAHTMGRARLRSERVEKKRRKINVKQIEVCAYDGEEFPGVERLSNLDKALQLVTLTERTQCINKEAIQEL